MRIKTRPFSHSYAAYRLFHTLLFIVSMSVLAPAQQRYTANRPTTPLQSPTKEKLAEYTPQHSVPIPWETDYEYAMRSAKLSSRPLLIYLYADYDQDLPDALAPMLVIPACRELETVTLDDTFVRSGLDKYVLLKLPMDAEITDEEGLKKSIYSLP